MSRWLERSCDWCHSPIPYLPEWTNIPQYCRDCNQWLEKECLNPRCSGTVKYKVYWSNISDYCSCKGWYEIKCAHCFQYFKINDHWDNKPEYCQSCREWKEKPCANKNCKGKVRYKEFWDSKSNYCTCKGWYEKKCENSHCIGIISVHSSWRNSPKYCSCKGIYLAKCTNQKCSNDVKNHVESSHQKTHCESCYKMSRRRNLDVIKDTRLEKWLQNSNRVVVKDYGDHFHVSITFEKGGGHVSGNVDKYSTETWGVHGVLYSYDQDGKHLKGEDIIIND